MPEYFKRAFDFFLILTFKSTVNNKTIIGNSLVVPWLRLCASTAGGPEFDS